MKKIVLIIGVAFLSSTLMAQNVGVGTLTPQAAFTVAANKTVLFGSDTLNAGAKMMWLPSKAAFRVGEVGGDRWNTANIGKWSFASGFETRATGNNSLAMGELTTASGHSATALGAGTTASGFYSTAMGLATYSTAFGSLSIGRYNDSITSSNRSVWLATDPLLILGNGTAPNARQNAMVVYKNGTFQLQNQTATPANISDKFYVLNGSPYFGNGKLEPSQLEKISEGVNTGWRLLGSNPFNHGDIGSNAVDLSVSVFASDSRGATGNYSTALGSSTTASGFSSTAMGNSTRALGGASTSMGNGTTALGNGSTAMGFSSDALGEYSTAIGRGTVASAYASLTIGQNNDSIAGSSRTSWVFTDPLLIIGNGWGAPLPRTNALVVYKNGNTDINGYTRLGNEAQLAPAIKTKKITGYTTPTSANPNSFTFVPHGLTASKILSISVLINASGNYEIMPQSTQTGYTYSVNTDPSGGGQANIAVGVKSAAESSSVMGRPIKIFITYEE